MIIDGTKVERGQNFKELNEHYFQAIQSIVAEALFELKFVQLINYRQSKTTDSAYFRFTMNHHDCLFTLSLRNHLPSEYKNAHFYIYLYDYDYLEELKTEIKEQLSDYYHKRSNKLIIVKRRNGYANSSRIPHTKKRRKKKTTNILKEY